jgi:hypothetical protein
VVGVLANAHELLVVQAVDGRLHALPRQTHPARNLWDGQRPLRQ